MVEFMQNTIFLAEFLLAVVWILACAFLALIVIVGLVRVAIGGAKGQGKKDSASL